MEPSHPVDPLAEQAPSIPQARRSVDPSTDAAEDSADAGVTSRTGTSGGPGAPSQSAAPGASGEPAALGEHGETAGPEQPAAQGSGEASADAGTAAKPLPRVWNLRSILLVVLAVVMVLGVGGVATGYYLYDKATEPDRSTPSLVSRQYIDAVFNDRDRRVARRFTCGDPADVAGGERLLAEITAKEQARDVRITINAEDVREQINGKAATVTARLRLNTVVNGRMQEQLQYWRFTLAQRSGGWRVCEATRTS